MTWEGKDYLYGTELSIILKLNRSRLNRTRVKVM